MVLRSWDKAVGMLWFEAIVAWTPCLYHRHLILGTISLKCNVLRKGAESLFDIL